MKTTTTLKWLIAAMAITYVLVYVAYFTSGTNAALSVLVMFLIFWLEYSRKKDLMVQADAITEFIRRG